MIYVRSTVEYRIVIPGRAFSFRSPHAKAYKAKIRRFAKSTVRRPLPGRNIEVLVDYFRTSKTHPDMDNISKCVLDALNGVAYKDDQQVRLQSSIEHFLGAPIHIFEDTVDLVKPLIRYKEYVFVRVRQG
jgi:Holliday junction resolvase RusA-like endonuclease